MCVICSKTPCHPRCPNANEVVVDNCAACFEDIFRENIYYKDDSGNKFCSLDCANEYYGIDEVRETEGDD